MKKTMTIKRLVALGAVVAMVAVMATVVFAAKESGTASPNVVQLPVIGSYSVKLGGGNASATFTTSKNPSYSGTLTLEETLINGNVYEGMPGKTPQQNLGTLYGSKNGFGTASAKLDYSDKTLTGEYPVYADVDFTYGTYYEELNVIRYAT